MKLTLMIEGSAAVIAAVLAGLPDGASVATPNASPAPVPPMPGAATVATPMPSPAPITAPGGDDDDSGPVNTAAPAVDATGLPWDERIHAATKNQNADGSWKARRGGPKGDALAAIEAELRARAGAATGQPIPPNPAPQPVASPAPVPMPQTAPAPIPMPANPEGDVTQPVPAPVPMPPVPMQPMTPPPAMTAPAPAVATQPVPAPVQTAVAQATGTLDFSQFMAHLAEQMKKRDGAGAPLIHADYLGQVTAEIGQAFNTTLSAITDIAANPNMINYAVQRFTMDGRW